jgi:hypothetical protein
MSSGTYTSKEGKTVLGFKEGKGGFELFFGGNADGGHKLKEFLVCH